MKLLLFVYRNEMTLIAFISGLMLWGLVATGLAFKNKTKLVLIGKTEGSYQLIRDEEESSLEIENFIRHFLALTLNFDEKSL